MKFTKLSDDIKSTFKMGGVKRSRQIMANGLSFQLPQGALINGITLRIEGQSSDLRKSQNQRYCF